MFLSPVTSFEVESYLSQMDNNKSIGPCSIPVPLLKILKTHISSLLSSLINDCFLCGIFPNKLKLAKVTPVFKKGSRQDKDNYRPISVLSVFSLIKKKAFDTVNHSILLLKLHHYGVRGKVYDWFQCYLSNKEQFVCVSGHDSDSLSVTCGVPQGSVLGPWLFLLYSVY